MRVSSSGSWKGPLRNLWRLSNERLRDCIKQGFSKSGLRNSIRTHLHLIFQAHSYHSDLRVARVAHTHTHRRMNQCCSDYRLFCKTKHIATSYILDKPLILFSRIMSPVSPRERGFAFPTQLFSTGRVSSVFKEPNRTEPQQTSE